VQVVDALRSAHELTHWVACHYHAVFLVFRHFDVAF
jgi:hypothetical protein